MKCQPSFRVYPTGVSNDHQSDTLNGLSVLLYILGLSYQGVADLLESRGQPVCKVTVYDNVQAAGQEARRLREQRLARQAGKVKVVGLDSTHVKCDRQDQIVAVATAVLTGQPFTFYLSEAETTLRAEQWIWNLASLVSAEILLTEHPDGLSGVADRLGLQQQICRAHVNCNVHDLIPRLGTNELAHPDSIPRQLSDSVTVDQFLED